MMISDSMLLKRSVEGDRGAFVSLLERYTPSLTRYAWAMMTSRSDVQDVIQETWVTAWTKRSSIRIVDKSILPWLLVTCRNHALNARRRNVRNASEQLPWEFPAHDSAELAREQLRWVMEEISQLDEADRRLCELCLIDGMPYRDAAELLGSTPGAARKRIERIRIRLRNAVTSND